MNLRPTGRRWRWVLALVVGVILAITLVGQFGEGWRGGAVIGVRASAELGVRATRDEVLVALDADPVTLAAHPEVDVKVSAMGGPSLFRVVVEGEDEAQVSAAIEPAAEAVMSRIATQVAPADDMGAELRAAYEQLRDQLASRDDPDLDAALDELGEQVDEHTVMVAQLQRYEAPSPAEQPLRDLVLVLGLVAVGSALVWSGTGFRRIR